MLFFLIPVTIPASTFQIDRLAFTVYNGICLGVDTLRLGAIYGAPYLEGELQDGIYDYFSGYCHQRPERSFSLNGRPFPVCSRCTGLYTGYFAAQLSCLLFYDFYARTIFDPAHIWLTLLVLGGGMLPMALDGGIQYLTAYESNNALRFGTGFLYGVSFSLLLNTGVNLLLKQLARLWE